MRPPIAISLLFASATLGGTLGASLSVETPEAAIATENACRVSAPPPGTATQRARRRVAGVVEAPDADAAAVPDDAETCSDEPGVLAEPPPHWQGLPLALRLVDGETGAVLSSGSVAAAEGWTWQRRPRDDERIALALDGDVHRLAATPGSTGERLSLAFDVDAPSGYIVATDEDVARTRVRVSPFARSLAVTVPLRRAIEVDVDVRAETGHRIERRLTGISVAVGDESFFPTMERPHRATIPFLRGEDLVAHATTATSWGETTVRLVEHMQRIDVRVCLPRERSNAGSYRGPAGCTSGCGPYVEAPPGDATLDLIVRLMDGRPARGAKASATLGRRTKCATVDASGVARFTRLPVGEWAVEVHAVGMVPSSATVSLAEREHRVLRLEEPLGETAEITVVNHRGERLPFARVRVGNTGLAPGAVQLLDHYTGPDGTCRVDRMPDEDVTIYAYWAGRSACGTWRPGEPVTVTVGE